MDVIDTRERTLLIVIWQINLSYAKEQQLTLSSLQTNTDAFANTVDPDETARNTSRLVKRAVSSGSTLFAILLLILD